MDGEFVTRPRTTQQAAIPFKIDGEDFWFQPPKNSTIALSAIKASGEGGVIAKETYVWLGQGLNPEHEPYGRYKGHESWKDGCQACRIEEKLKDPNDNLDIYVLADIVAWLMKQAGGERPPSSSGAPSGWSPGTSGPTSTAGAPPRA